MDRGRDLLYGVIALQLGFVSQQQFVEVMALLSHRADRSAQQLFLERGYLTGAPSEAISRLMALKLRRNGGDAARSLDSMAVAPTVAQSIAAVSTGEADGARGGTLPGTVVEGVPAAERTEPAGPPTAPQPRRSGAVPAKSDAVPLARQVSRERYGVGDELGRGGIGRVVIAVDHDLMEREVAMKLLQPAVKEGTRHKGRSAEMRARFLEEAQLTARLQHPNIVAVYELGTSSGGELYYTMPVLRGRTLKVEIADAHGRRARGEPTKEEWSVARMQLLTIFQGVCNAIAYAHSCGVIHRDIKPHNVMIGEFGETVVLDWGLAKVLAGRAALGSGEPGITRSGASRSETRSDRELQKLMRSLRRRPGQETAEGSIAGTPAYMAPEQAQGRISEMDERSDVYSLGSLLFELLTGRPPHLGENGYAVLFRMMTSPTPDPREAAPPGDVDDDIAAICMKAMSKEKGDRYPSVTALSREIALYMEGAKERQRRRDQASRLVRLGEQRAKELAQFQREAAELVVQVREAAATFRGPVPIERKRPLWALEDRAATVAREAMVARAEAERTFHKALEWEAANASARSGLADLYYDRFRDAEASGSEDARHYYRELVESYHDGRYAHALQGDGTLAVHTEPAGAQLFLFRNEIRDRRLVPVPWEAGSGYVPKLAPGAVATAAGWYLKLAARDTTCHVGASPIEKLTIPMGTYLLVARKKGYRDLRCPVHVRRNQDVRLDVRLHRDADIGEGFVLVPSGQFDHGGDRTFDNALPAGSTWIDDFVISRYPVTCAEYLEYLEDLDPAKALSHTPRRTDGSVFWTRDDDGRFHLPDLSAEGSGLRFSPRHPVVHVSWEDAVAYAAWRSQRDGREYRLPHELEWEKAARGVDLRVYPWGDAFEPVWCNVVESREGGKGLLGPVGEFPTDESPYGVADLAGNVFDWCRNLFMKEKHWRALRGGVFQGMPLWSRTTARAGFIPTEPYAITGFRLVTDPFGRPRGGLREEPELREPGVR